MKKIVLMLLCVFCFVLLATQVFAETQEEKSAKEWEALQKIGKQIPATKTAQEKAKNEDRSPYDIFSTYTFATKDQINKLITTLEKGWELSGNGKADSKSIMGKLKDMEEWQLRILLYLIQQNDDLSIKLKSQSNSITEILNILKNGGLASDKGLEKALETFSRNFKVPSNELAIKNATDAVNQIWLSNVEFQNKIEAKDKLIKEMEQIFKDNIEDLERKYKTQVASLEAQLEEAQNKLRERPTKKGTTLEIKNPKTQSPALVIYTTAGGCDFVGASQFDIAKWLNDENSQLEHQAGGEAGLGILIKQLVFIQGSVGISGNNSDQHLCFEAGLNLKGFRAGYGTLYFQEEMLSVIYASVDNWLSPFIRIQPKKDAGFLQFGLVAKVNLTGLIKR